MNGATAVPIRITLLLTLAVAATPAEAVCMSARLINLDGYVYTPGILAGTGYMGSTVTSGFTGSFWALTRGNPEVGSGIDNGSFAALEDGWIHAEPGFPAGGLRFGVSRTWAASNKIDGCIDFSGDRCMALLFADQNDVSGHFWLATDAPDALFNYDLTPDGTPADVTLSPVPAPVLLDVPPFGQVFAGPKLTDLGPGLDLDPECNQDMVLGFKVYRLVSDVVPSDYTRDNGDPNSGWELHPDGQGPDGAPLPLGATVTLSSICPAGRTSFYAYTLIFESGFETAFVSAPSVDIVCDCGGADADGDGFCAGTGTALADCDDADPTVFPGAPELCDRIGNDCQAARWPDLPDAESDADGDGIAGCEGDCDDTQAAVFPGGQAICDGLNNDCDDPAWPDVTGDEADLDNDGFSICAGDCDDTNRNVAPGAAPRCDGLNNDCDDPEWPNFPSDEVDADGDGLMGCEGDCDDGNAAVLPGAEQVCDGFNNDCLDVAWPALSGTNEADDDGDGSTECAGDCDDAASAVFPGAPDLCDGLNNDCNAPDWPSVPEDELDQDRDGSRVCSGECDDTDPSVFPGAAQLCDGVNNDCTDATWPAVPDDELDGDGDGAPACFDCDDSDPSAFPGTPDVCDGVDNDCDGDVDEGRPEICNNEIDDDCDGLIDRDDRANCDTLSVTLESLSADSTRRGVLIRWTTASEIDTVGFRILRGRRGSKLRVITPQLIPSAGSEVAGATYQYTDATAQPPGRVDYYLEDVDLEGRSTRHGPLIVHIPHPRKESRP